MHGAHDAREHGAVAHTRVEQAHGGRLGMDVAELARDALAHHPLLAAGIDEEQIFLAVVEEPEMLLGLACRRSSAGRAGRAGLAGAHADGIACAIGQTRIGMPGQGSHACASFPRLMGGHEGAQAFQRIGGDAAAIAKPLGELAVVDRKPPEGGLGHAGLAAIIRNLTQDRVFVHRLPS